LLAKERKENKKDSFRGPILIPYFITEVRHLVPTRAGRLWFRFAYFTVCFRGVFRAQLAYSWRRLRCFMRLVISQH